MGFYAICIPNWSGIIGRAFDAQPNPYVLSVTPKHTIAENIVYTVGLVKKLYTNTFGNKKISKK